MPKIEAKEIQRQLSKNEIWPVYCLYGSESMKTRELTKKIRKTLHPDWDEGLSNTTDLRTEIFDGGEVTGDTVLDAANCMSLLGGTKLVLVKNAHLLKDSEVLEGMMAPPMNPEDLHSVVVLISKDLDGRKKFTKTLNKSAAVVPCEEIQDQDKAAWIEYLCKRREMSIEKDDLLSLSMLDPWSLDIIDQELEKIQIMEGDPLSIDEVNKKLDPKAFIDALLNRQSAQSLVHVKNLAMNPNISLPLLGLLTWNVRQLVVFLASKKSRRSAGKMNPYLEQKLRFWEKKWELEEAIELQRDISQLDFYAKQTPKESIGLWTELAIKWC